MIEILSDINQYTKKMSEFSEAILEKKLTELRDSQKEIQSLSNYCVHNRQHCKIIVRAWYKNLKVTAVARKLTAMYLANDVVQNSKKKGPEFAKEFGHVLKKSFDHLSSLKLDDKTIVSLARLISIWMERQIFDRKILHEITRIWEHKRKTGKQLLQSEHISPKRRSQEVSAGSGSEERRKSRDAAEIDVDDMLDASMEAAVAAEKSKPVPQAVEILTLSPRQGGSPGSGDPPEPEELIQALQDLENSASSDAVVREKIAKLPPEVSEVTKLEGIKSAEAQVLQGQVEEANTLLDDYNRRLQEELRYRKKVGKMIGEFLSAQKDLLAQAEERLETYLDKLEKIHQVKEELKSHIASLPDIPVVSEMSVRRVTRVTRVTTLLVVLTRCFVSAADQHRPGAPALGWRPVHTLRVTI